MRKGDVKLEVGLLMKGWCSGKGRRFGLDLFENSEFLLVEFDKFLCVVYLFLNVEGSHKREE